MAHIKPFRFECQKVIPMVFDDSLSYYEVLCKVVAKLNEMGASVNDINDALEELIASLPDEIQEKIDEYVATDEFKEVVAEIIGEFGVSKINGKTGEVTLTGEDINYDDDPDSATLSEAIDSKVTMNTEESVHKQLYAKDTDGTQILQNLDSTGSDKGAGDVPVRNDNGNLETGNPTQNLECATKKYVDDKNDEKVGKITSGTSKKAYIHIGETQSDLGIDSLPNKDSENLVTSGGVVEYVESKQMIKRYGFKRKKAESNPSARIEYMYDAVNMTPAHMDFENGTFSWGDWEGFVNDIARPVMLKLDGTVDYELSHDDQTKKIDGTASDIANTAYNGNAMVEFKTFKWVKRYEDATYEYVIFSNKRLDNGYHDYAHNGKDVFYYGMFTSQKVGSVLRSFGVNNSSVSQNAEAQITQSKANGNGYNIHDHMKWSYILDLLVLIGKSDNLQGTYGEGNSGTLAQIANGTLKDKGCFFGDTGAENAVKVLWIENLWGNIWQRMHGLICDNGTYKTKATAPFCDTPVSAANYSAYRNTGITAPTGGYVKDAYNTDLDAFLPKTVDGSASTYFCDYFYINATIVSLALAGGYWSAGGACGRYVYLNYAASTAYGNVGSRLSYT